MVEVTRMVSCQTMTVPDQSWRSWAAMKSHRDLAQNFDHSWFNVLSYFRLTLFQKIRRGKIILVRKSSPWWNALEQPEKTSLYQIYIQGPTKLAHHASPTAPMLSVSISSVIFSNHWMPWMRILPRDQDRREPILWRCPSLAPMTFHRNRGTGCHYVARHHKTSWTAATTGMKSHHFIHEKVVIRHDTSWCRGASWSVVHALCFPRSRRFMSRHDPLHGLPWPVMTANIHYGDRQQHLTTSSKCARA